MNSPDLNLIGLVSCLAKVGRICRLGIILTGIRLKRKLTAALPYSAGSIRNAWWSDNMAPDNAGIARLNDEILSPYFPAVYNRMVSGKVPVKYFIDDYLLPQAIDISTDMNRTSSGKLPQNFTIVSLF